MNTHRILVAPLDWGLGHATRCVPLIRKFHEQGHEVILTAQGRSEYFLKREFPQLEFVSSPGYRIRYSTLFPMWLMMMLQGPGILLNTYHEHLWLKRFVKLRNIDEVISDNRYGLWSNNIRCVFITHQVMIKCPRMLKFLETPLHWLVSGFMKKYSECWIPDTAGEDNLSGDLSHQYALPENAKYIGWLSRFDHAVNQAGNQSTAGMKQSTYSLCIILSGPEPLRTKLENKIRRVRPSMTQKVLLVLGKPEALQTEDAIDNLHIVAHLSEHELEQAILQSDTVMCRAGYSSIMDMKVLRKKAILIPTPGQTEQEYLASHLDNSGSFKTIKEEDFTEELLKLVQESNSQTELTEESLAEKINEYSG